MVHFIIKQSKVIIRLLKANVIMKKVRLLRIFFLFVLLCGFIREIGGGAPVSAHMRVRWKS